MIKAPQSEENKHVIQMSLLKDAKVVVEAGHHEGWGHVLDLPPKFDKFGIGFRPTMKSTTPKLSSSFTHVKFASGGIVKDGQVNAATDEVDNDYEMDQ